MANKRIISDGEKLIEVVEGELRAPPPPHTTPKKKTRRPRHQKGYNPNTRKPTKKSIPEITGENHPLVKKRSSIPGYREWLRRRMWQINQFLNKPGASQRRCNNTPKGLRREDVEMFGAYAREKAKIDMANMEAAGLLPDDEIATQATQATLEIMHNPMNQDMRLKAARQLLEWYKAKPQSKSEVTVNTAEAWLASLAEEK
jgi:hypothetical protein